MEAENRTKTAYLIDKLSNSPRSFSFIQTLRILKLYNNYQSDYEFQNNIKIRPELTLDFPRSDIASIALNNEANRAAIDATFLGLYGTSSPLPTFYTEELLDEQRDGYSVSRDFLDILNNSLYHLLFKVWQKYNLPINILENKNTNVENILYSFVGLGVKSIREQIPHHYSLIKYAGLFIHNPRTSDGLRAIVMQHLGTEDVEIVECIARAVKISQSQICKIGENGNSIGNDCYIGSIIHDINGKFRIKVIVNDYDKFQSYLPNSYLYLQLKALVSFYLSSNLDWDFEILLNQKCKKHYGLGELGFGRLGYDAWLLGIDECCFNNILINPTYEEKMRNAS